MEDKCVKGLNPATYCDIRLDFKLFNYCFLLHLFFIFNKIIFLKDI